MVRSDIKLDINDRIEVLQEELAEKKRLFPTQSFNGKTNAYKANKHYLVLSDFIRLLQLAKQKGLSYNQLNKLLKELPGKQKPTQNKLQFPS